MNTQCQKAFPAMVQPVPQHAGNVFSPGQALQNGTLFPELYKPMNGRQCSGGCYGANSSTISPLDKNRFNVFVVFQFVNILFSITAFANIFYQH